MCVYLDQIISVTTMHRVFVLAMSLLAASHFRPSGYGYGYGVTSYGDGGSYGHRYGYAYDSKGNYGTATHTGKLFGRL